MNRIEHESNDNQLNGKFSQNIYQTFKNFKTKKTYLNNKSFKSTKYKQNKTKYNEKEPLHEKIQIS